MKKFITLALALVMALSLAAPAMAFTNIAYQANADTPIELAIKLVDVENGYISVNFNAPPTNRGYLKNEVVCAVVSMYVPKDVNPADDYDELIFSGKNVSVWQDENFRPVNTAGTWWQASLGGGRGMLNYMSSNAYNALFRNADTYPFFYANDMAIDNKITLPEGGGVEGLSALEPSSNQTYHFAIFGKVLGDDAYMNVTLKGTGGLDNADMDGTLNYVKVGDYYVGYFNPNETADDALKKEKPEIGTTLAKDGWLVDYISGKEVAYVVAKTANPAGATGTKNEYLFLIVTDKDFNCKRMYVFDPDLDSTSAFPGTIALPGLNDTGSAPADYLQGTATRVGSGYEVVSLSRGGYSPRFLSGRIQIEDMANKILATDRTNVLGDTDTLFNTLLRKILEDIVWEDFGLDPTISGMLKKGWWVSNAEIYQEVAVEPWYAEVTVPPEIEIDPPKTGDAMNVLGFVLIALAGLAVVAVRKVRA